MHRRPTFILLALILLTFTVMTNPVRAASPAIQGWAWIDQNCDGLRQDGEPSAKQLFVIYLYRFGADGLAFTADDRQVRVVPAGLEAGQYEDTTDSSLMLPELYRLSILQGGRPVGYVPTLYRQGSDPARWSSLQGNWTTGDPEDNGFVLDPNGTVTGGNIGIAPVSCVAQWYSERVYLPLLGS